MGSIDLVNVSFQYDKNTTAHGMAPQKSFILDDISLHCPEGKITVILGPSGCGKSTLLKIIAGLITQDRGEVYCNNKAINELLPGDRRIGMVFEDFALYPHYDSETNITSFFFFKKKTPEMDAKKQELFQRTSELMGVEIKHLLSRKPPTLSGGEKQRVAIGRCITREPNIFLLDEPFGKIDARARDEYRGKLKKLLSHFGVSTVYVTHDHREAAYIADELVIMNDGTIEQVGKTSDIFESPATMFVAEFFNLDDDAVAINFFDGNLFSSKYAGTTIGARPDDISVDFSSAAHDETAEIVEVIPLLRGNRYHLVLQWKGVSLHVRAVKEKAPSLGSRVGIEFPKFHVFDSENGQRKFTVSAEAAVAG